MSLFNTINFIINHPLNKGRRLNAIFRFLLWQVNTRINPYPIIYPFLEDSKLIMKKGLTGATGNLYCGLHEFEDMSFVLHFLREDDHFMDVGANVGSYTILASGVAKAKTIAVEPISSAFSILLQNITINNLQEKVKALNIGLSSKPGVLKCTSSLDTTNHIATNNDNDAYEIVDITVRTLDEVASIAPALIKIDVEGFETQVLMGAEKTLTNTALKAIIIELNGSGAKYGFDEKKIHKKLLELGFHPYEYQPFDRQLIALKSFGRHNTLYVRDYDLVAERVEKAKKIKVLDQLI